MGLVHRDLETDTELERCSRLSLAYEDGYDKGYNVALRDFEGWLEVQCSDEELKMKFRNDFWRD